MNIKDITKQFLSQVGYHEKKSNKDLYTDKNNGNKNFTKYADIVKNTDLLNGNKQGAAWCAVFIIANFYVLFGEEKTHKILNIPKNSAAAGCPFLYQYVKNVYSPKEGYLIFFGSGKPSHVGYVYKVDDNKVYTIEGNTDNKVKKHSYNLGSNKIFGYGRPDYSYIADDIYNEINTYKVKALSGLRVRRAPNTNCDTISVLKFGSTIKGKKYNESWIEVENGYCYAKWLEVIK